MNDKLRAAAAALVNRATQAGLVGSLADLDDLHELNEQCKNRIPSWYIELITTVPLCNLELGCRTDVDDETDITWLQWSDVRNMRSEMIDCYPGLAILQRGYINVAGDSTGGGDPFFIPTDKGEDPALYQVYHDISDDPDKILEQGLELVANSLSEFFDKAIFEE